VAIKKQQMSEVSLSHTCLREIDTLKQLADHPNIINLLETYIESENNKKHVVFIFEYCEQGDLRSFISRYNKKLPLSVVIDFTHQIFQGLAFMHDKGFIHRDLKP
jgi:serine/threonine protein kinase